MKDTEDDYLSLKEAAEYAHVTKQAIYIAIRSKKMKATKAGRFWIISRKDLDEYRANKYNPQKKKYEGELVFDMHQGYFSVQQVAKTLSEILQRPYDSQHIYYLLRSGQLTGYRKGNSWVIKREDAVELLEQEKNKVRFGNMENLNFA